MKILFIGGNGNISWHCLNEAIKAGHEVYALNRGLTVKTRREVPSSVIQLTADIRNAQETSKVLDEMKFDVVCDFICFNKEQAELDIKLFKEKTKQFIFVSSEAVYVRNSKYLPCDENTPKNINTKTPYLKGKIDAEEVFINAYKNWEFPITIVRPSYTYDTIIPVSLGHNCFTVPQRLIDGKPLLVAGEGSNLWTFTHSSDFANAFIGLVGNEKTIGEAFNITSDEWLSWNDVSEILLDALEIKNKRIIHIPYEEVFKTPLCIDKELMEQKMWHNIYNISKIKGFLPDWQPKIKLEQGIKLTLNWLFEEDVRRRFNPELDKILEEVTSKYENLAEVI
jgi:nucleoside-diphosphate-sugar epimerase